MNFWGENQWSGPLRIKISINKLLDRLTTELYHNQIPNRSHKCDMFQKIFDNDRPVPQVFLNNHVNHIMWLSRRIFIAFLWFSNKHSIYWKHLTTKVKFNEVQFANSSLLVEKKSWNDVMKRKVFPSHSSWSWNQ